MKRIILTTANNRYFDILRAFLASMRYHGNNTEIAADLINFTDNQVGSLCKIYENLTVSRIDIPYTTKVPETDLLRLMYTRPNQMWRALNGPYEQVMSMDCDILIRGSLEHIWDGVKPNSFKILVKKCDKNNSKTHFQGGVYILGVSDATISFYKEIMDTIGSEFGFWDGQRALCEIYEKNRDGIELIKMDRTYNDERKLNMNKKSIVWHIKHRNFDLKIVKKELNKYLQIANTYENNVP